MTTGMVTGDAIISSVDLSKSIVLRLGAKTNNSVATGLISLRLEDSTTLRAARYISGNYAYTKYAVLEFSSGVSVQRGTLVLNGVDNNTTTITSVDTSKATVINNGVNVSSNIIDYVSDIQLINATTLQGTRRQTGGICTVWWEVVGFI